MKVVLRLATEDDYGLMLKWRNDPEIMRACYSQKDGHKISWSEHLNWIKSRNQDFRIYMIWAGEDENILQRVGVINLGQLDHWEPEHGILIGEKSFWGKGIAPQATLLMHEKLKSWGYEYVRLTIMDNNHKTVGYLTSMGFKRVGEARPGESLYRLKL